MFTLKREQREDALVHLQVAPVDAVVVADHHLRELHVLVVERLEHPVELLHDQVEAAEGVIFELAQLRLEVRPTVRRLAAGRLLSGCVPSARQRGPVVRVSRTCR
jgi:nanoRNase/pAp phosphatase (c-di-AMP/oligoRNAs hydrolase)